MDILTATSLFLIGFYWPPAVGKFTITQYHQRLFKYGGLIVSLGIFYFVSLFPVACFVLFSQDKVGFPFLIYYNVVAKLK